MAFSQSHLRVFKDIARPFFWTRGQNDSLKYFESNLLVDDNREFAAAISKQSDVHGFGTLGLMEYREPSP